MQNTEKIKEFWDTRASAENVSEQQVTHRDVWQRWLEIEMIKKFVRPTDRMLDVGCGNGYTTRRLAPLVREIVGVDYSSEMVKRAGESEGPEGVSENITFQVQDVLALNPERFGMFDVALSERCLINLASREEQERAIANIASVIKPGGRFIFVEGSQQGRAGLNKMRRSVGLEEMAPVWHNLDFDEPSTLEYLDKFFSVEEKLHFGVYDFVARVAHPLIVAPKIPEYDSRINEVAAELALHSQEFGEISRVLFLVLRRK